MILNTTLILHHFSGLLIRQIDILCHYFDSVFSLQSQTWASSLVSPSLFLQVIYVGLKRQNVQKVGCVNLQGASLGFFEKRWFCNA